jgi:hypothetical protein
MAGHGTAIRSPANLELTCHGKRLPLVARPASTPDVFSNSYGALLLLAVPWGGFEPRRPRPFPVQRFLNVCWQLLEDQGAFGESYRRC